MTDPKNPPPPPPPPDPDPWHPVDPRRPRILIRTIARDLIVAYDAGTGRPVADARMVRLGTWEVVCRGVTRMRRRRRAALRTLTQLALGAR